MKNVPVGLNRPSADMNLEMLLWGQPADQLPVLSLEGFERLSETHSPDQIRWLNQWIAPQATVDAVLAQVGPRGLRRVLKGIASASADKRVPMSDRVRSVAAYYELPVY